MEDADAKQIIPAFDQMARALAHLLLSYERGTGFVPNFAPWDVPLWHRMAQDGTGSRSEGGEAGWIGMHSVAATVARAAGRSVPMRTWTKV